jgi:ATP-dependent RNA helicase HelY
VPNGRWAGVALVLEPGAAKRVDDPSPLVLTVNRQVKQLALMDFRGPVEPVERIRIPTSFSRKSPQHRRDLASALRNKTARIETPRPAKRREATGEDPEITELRRLLREHPCHGCAEREDHSRWAERYFRLERETADLRRRVEGRSQVISRTFDRVCAVLEQLGYLKDERVTDAGRRLGRLYSESDLLTAECLREGIWDGLDSAELAACLSALVYESRQADDGKTPRIPAGPVRETLTEMVRLAEDLGEVERDHRVAFLREPDMGFVWAAYRWARGHQLDAVLSDADLTAGDFVRWTKQLLDLLGQVADAAPRGSGIRDTAGKAMDAMRRGVVAYSSVA